MRQCHGPNGTRFFYNLNLKGDVIVSVPENGNQELRKAIPVPVADMCFLAKDMAQYTGTPVDAHAQMLAARVEGLEKDINGLQHVWGRVKTLESALANAKLRIDEAMNRIDGIKAETHKANKPAASLDTSRSLLSQCLAQLPPCGELTGRIAEFLRNR